MKTWLNDFRQIFGKLRLGRPFRAQGMGGAETWGVAPGWYRAPRWGLALALVLILAAGCKVGPDYHRPQVSTPAQWGEPMTGGETNAPVTATDWWKTFNDPELDSLIARAVHSNLDLR